MSKLPTHRTSLSPPKSAFRRSLTPSSPQRRSPFREDTPNGELRIDDRVTVRGESGTVAFIGSTNFAAGEWIGIILDEAHGKNDGTHGGIRYFETDANRGLFCRRDTVQRLSLNGASQRNSVYTPSILPTIEETNNATNHPPSTINLELDDRVIIRGKKYGTLKYIGKFHVDDGIWCGIKLDDPSGKHDGKVDGIRYFKCQHRYGVLVPLHHVEKVASNSSDSRSFQRQSMISTDSFDHFRDSPSPNSNISEISNSPNSMNLFPPRSPKKIPQPNFSTDLKTIRTLSSPAEVSHLREKLNEKDKSIEKFKKEHQKDHLELSESLEKIHSMKQQITTLQHQYEVKENQNAHLIQEQVQLRQRLENLQFQLEEYQSPESNLEQLINDPQLVLSVNGIENFAETNEKLAQLETINQILTDEKELLQQELKQLHEMKESETQAKTYIDELERTIETFKLQIADLQSKTNQWNEKETFYKQQISEYQSKMDQITKQDENNRLKLTTFEQEKYTNEKKIKDLLTELRRYKESIVPDLEEECQILKSELQNREATSNVTLSERETFYEKQIKQYENNLNQAMRETQNIQTELAKLETEKATHDENFNTTINTLKQDYERQYEILKVQLTQLENKDQTHNIILNERVGYYEIQIKEHQMKINQHVREIELLQTELTNLREEKLTDEKQWESMVQKFKQDYEILHAELQDRDRTQSAAINECEVHYISQIKELQIKINQSFVEIEELQSQLTKFEAEKTIIENQCKETINTLEQDHQRQSKELQNEIDELNEREHKAHRDVHQREAEFEQQIKDYENRVERGQLETQRVQIELAKFQEEKSKLSNTVNTLKEEIEKLKAELFERDHRELTSVAQRDYASEIRIKEYQIQSEQDSREIQVLRTELTSLQEEKATQEKQLNDMTIKFEHDYETLKNELHQRDQTQNMAMNDREIHYQSQIKELQIKRDHSLLEIHDLQSHLRESHEEKTTLENHLNEIISNLKQDHERLSSELQNEIGELNERERKAHKTVHQREAEFEQQITDYENRIEQANLETQRVQIELAKFQEEQSKLNHTNNSLKLDVDRLKIELQERDQTQNMAINDREVHYHAQIKELREEKITIENQFNETVNNLKQDHERQYGAIQAEVEELNERERGMNRALEQREIEIEQQIKKFQDKLEQANLETQYVKSQLVELQDRGIILGVFCFLYLLNFHCIDQTQNMTINDRETHYQSQIEELQTQRDQSLLELQDHQSRLIQLREEKTTIENQLHETIDSLKHDQEKKQRQFQFEIDELNEREHGINKALQQREVEIEQQIKEFKNELEHVHGQLSEVQQEKMKLDDINNTLQQNLQRLEADLQDREQTQNMAMNEREIHYQSQIKELQTTRDQSLLDIQDLQLELHQMTDTIGKLNQDNKKLQNNLNEREHQQKQILEEHELQYKQQIHEHQKNLEVSSQEVENLKSDLANLREEKQENEKLLNDLMMSIQEDFQQQIETLKTKNVQLQHDYDTTTNQLTKDIQDLQQKNETNVEQISQLKTEYSQRTESLTQINEKLKQELDDFKNRNKQTNSQDSNQTTDNNKVNDQLMKQLNDLQQMYDDILEKEANMEQKYAEERKAQENIMKEKITEYETRLILARNEYMVEMQNTQLDHDQEVLRLKSQLQEATATKKKK
ncbi:unnamed protein product [Rotaria socialis]|uniref:CAP-Gly domain-containing protein n=1 Tax=Rotaria socialis TaxID=392032 RepID=A0A818I527_9BILA|nr:unnamed protein product [Rotaria socialis]